MFLKNLLNSLNKKDVFLGLLLLEKPINQSIINNRGGESIRYYFNNDFIDHITLFERNNYYEVNIFFKRLDSNDFFTPAFNGIQLTKEQYLQLAESWQNINI